MAQWTHPMCDKCWRAFALGSRGDARTTPVRLKQEVREKTICCTCGDVNIAGIYIRADARMVLFPAEDTDD